MLKTIRVSCAATIVLCTACPDKESESASSSEATTTGTPTTSEATTTEATTTEALTTTTGPTTGATTGEPLCDADMAGFEASCEQVCGAYAACDAEVDPAACAETCKTDTLFKDTPACLCSATARNACRGALDCAGLDALGTVASAPCFAEEASYLIHCADCYVQPEFLAADMCVTIVECPDVLGVSFLCQGGTCVCNDGEADYASCPDPGVCAGMDAEALNAAARECCGIPF